MRAKSYIFPVLLAMIVIGTLTPAWAARIADIANTKHNLSNSGPGSVKATTETQICIFCHTPHAAEALPKAPLWNRKLSAAIYTLYDSSSLEATDIGQPTEGSSKLCLSCHDGTLAIGAVNVLNGTATDQNPATADITMNGTDAGGVMPAGTYGATSGTTRNLGINLSNDHPISFTYNTALANADGELRDPATNAHIGNRSSGVNPPVPLDANKVECISCHDPHVRDSVDGDIKFLRLNRFQTTSDPAGSAFNASNDIICLACHDKTGWVDSAHANEQVADEVYTNTAATQRGFPNALPVWRAACLNCHDSHTVQGARRLLREGTDSVTSPKQGGNAAQEETCYQCHSSSGGTLTSQGLNTQVPDIKTDFERSYHMPIRSDHQLAGMEVHDIGANKNDVPANAGKDLIESPGQLGKASATGGSSNNRHIECTDCHNPHRVIKNRQANGNPAAPDAAATHDHWTEPHSNIASGVLRGSWGIEPVYSGKAFFDEPVSFTIKRGNVASNADMSSVAQPYVTREYQVCFKCHSKYAYDQPFNVGYGQGVPGSPTADGLTGYNTNGMTQYTSNAREFQAPATHKGEGQSLGGEAGAFASNFACSDFGTCNLRDDNHRSWHPVMEPTGRTKAIRTISGAGLWQAPWDNNVGNQTMYCSDCHGQATAVGTVDPDGQASENGVAWGTHGSDLPFILKGKYDFMTGTPCTADCNTPDTRTDQQNDLCFKCHSYANYADPNCSDCGSSAFRKAGSNNLHTKHASRLKRMKCMWCHVSTPHGWKNKAFLVNLNDLGREVCNPNCPADAKYQPANQGGDTFATGGVEHPLSVNGGVTQPLYMGPYYYNAILKIVLFASSGNWDPKMCGSRKFTGAEGTGQGWMTNTCNNLP